MKGIIAVNNLGFIGLNDGLPWHSKADFRHFKEKTSQGEGEGESTLLAGFRTFQTLPPLKGRKVLLLGRDMFPVEHIDWCIGGKATYERLCPLFTELHISHINDNTIGDTLFPNLKYLNPECKIFNYYFEID